MLQTLRSHDQFNTTIYGLDDRYRGILGGRRVVFVNADDLAALGLANNQQVDLIGHWADDDVRAPGERLPDRRLRHPARLRGGVLPGDQPAGAAGLHGRGEQHPDVEVGDHLAGARPAPRTATETGATESDAMDATGADDGHKSHPEPIHLS